MENVSNSSWPICFRKSIVILTFLPLLFYAPPLLLAAAPLHSRASLVRSGSLFLLSPSFAAQALDKSVFNNKIAGVVSNGVVCEIQNNWCTNVWTKATEQSIQSYNIPLRALRGYSLSFRWCLHRWWCGCRFLRRRLQPLHRQLLALPWPYSHRLRSPLRWGLLLLLVLQPFLCEPCAPIVLTQSIE
jgi:hypothetical protein